MARVKPKYLIILIAAVVISAAILSVVILQPPVTGVQGRSVAVTWGLLAEIVYRLGGGEIEV
ncbi:MAG: hypothetical protein NZ938_05510, partial [Aigarchaeota archaeon]|nr:hypothetical protein [Candidatus Calditenuaceae archaeon]